MTYTLVYRRESDREPMVLDVDAHSTAEAEWAVELVHHLARRLWSFIRTPRGAFVDYERGLALNGEA